MKINKNIECFVNFDLRGENYKASKNHRTERLKPLYVHMIVNFFFILLMTVLYMTEGAKSFREADGVASFSILIIVFIMHCMYIFLSETTNYRKSNYYYNNTAAYVVTLSLIMILSICSYLLKLFDGTIKIRFIILIVALSLAINVVIVTIKIKRGNYLKSKKHLNKEWLFPVFAVMFFLGRWIAEKHTASFFYACIVLLTAGMCNSLIFYSLQIFYAKKYRIGNLLPQIRIEPDEP